jgi:hypothetical protein
MHYRCTALHGLSVAYATEELKKDWLRVPNSVRASAMCICVSVWNKDPVFGVIGIQSGLWRNFDATPTLHRLVWLEADRFSRDRTFDV